MNTDQSNSIVSEVESGEAVLLDVRRDDEWAAGHGKPAVHFESSRVTDNGELPDIPKDKKIYIHCQAGGRAGRVKNKLIEAGFTDAHNLGGLSDWESAGGEVIR